MSEQNTTETVIDTVEAARHLYANATEELKQIKEQVKALGAREKELTNFVSALAPVAGIKRQRRAGATGKMSIREACREVLSSGPLTVSELRERVDDLREVETPKGSLNTTLAKNAEFTNIEGLWNYNPANEKAAAAKPKAAKPKNGGRRKPQPAAK